MLINRREAFTLVEILVSLGIIVTVTALGLPAVKDALQSNSTARSADVVRGAFETARRMAIHKGLPCGVLIERRSSLQRVDKDDRYTASYLTDSNTANFSARLSYVQIPSQYPSTTVGSAKVYPFYSLVGPQHDNCNREMKFYVKREDAELLYAAAVEYSKSARQGQGRGPGDRNPNARADPPGLASRLINQGTKIEIKLDGSNITQFIRTLEVAPNGLNAGVVREFVPNGQNPVASCGSPVLDPTPEQQVSGPGVIFTTNESLIPDVSRREISETDEFAGKIYQAVPFCIQLDPIPMAMAPINLPGRNVIDLSVSGTRDNPMLFNVQELLATLPRSTLDDLSEPQDSLDRIPVSFHSIIILFGESGAVDSIYVDRWNSSLYNFERVRVTPPSTMAFLVGRNNAIPDNIDDIANYPSSPGAVALGTEGGIYDPSFVPNLMNSDCQWVHLNSQTGVADVSPIASQPSDNFIKNYFGWSNPIPSNRQISKQRIERSRRLVYGGAK